MAARHNLSTSTCRRYAITKRLSHMSDAELAALEQRMIAAAPIVLEATAEVPDDAGELSDGVPTAQVGRFSRAAELRRFLAGFMTRVANEHQTV